MAHPRAPGLNYRLDEVSRAIGVASSSVSTRSSSAAGGGGRYGELLGGVDGVELPLRRRRRPRALLVRLRRASSTTDRPRRGHRPPRRGGCRSKPYLPSIHLQPYWREQFGTSEGMFPVAENVSRGSLALPFHTQLAAEDQERVAEASLRALRYSASVDNPRMADAPTMVFLGFGKFARADKIYALEPLTGKRARRRPAHASLGRGHRRADRGVSHRALDPHRDGRARCSGARSSSTSAVALAERIVEDADKGRVDLADLGTAGPPAARVDGQAGADRPALLRFGRSRATSSREACTTSRPISSAARSSSTGSAAAIVEVEAYDHEDPASHGFRGRDGAEPFDVRAARARLRLPVVRDPLVPQSRLRGRGSRGRRPDPRAGADARPRPDARAPRRRGRAAPLLWTRASSARRLP